MIDKTTHLTPQSKCAQAAAKSRSVEHPLGSSLPIEHVPWNNWGVVQRAKGGYIFAWISCMEIMLIPGGH